MKLFIKNFLIFLIIFLIIAGIFSLINFNPLKIEQITLDQLIKEIQN